MPVPMRAVRASDAAGYARHVASSVSRLPPTLGCALPRPRGAVASMIGVDTNVIAYLLIPGQHTAAARAARRAHEVGNPTRVRVRRTVRDWGLQQVGAKGLAADEDGGERG